MRCHPFLREELAAIETRDVVRFDRILFRHLRFFAGNAARALLWAFGVGRPRNQPHDPLLRPHLRRLARMSAAFALASDLTLATLGGAFKRREKLSGRLADAIAWMYVASAAVKRFHDDGRRAADVPLLAWTCETALWTVQQSLVAVCDNLPARWAGRLLSLLIFPLGARRKPPRDALGAAVARSTLDGGDVWVRLTGDIFVPDAGEQGLGNLETALGCAVAVQPAARKIREGIRRGMVETEPSGLLIERAGLQGLVDRCEAESLVHAATAVDAAIAVDAYSAKNYDQLKG